MELRENQSFIGFELRWKKVSEKVPRQQLYSFLMHVNQLENVTQQVAQQIGN